MEFIADDTQENYRCISDRVLGPSWSAERCWIASRSVITALVVAFSCCWSTAKFDVAVHEFALFQAAPDEPFYLSLATGAPLSLDYRFSSRILIAALRAVGITSFDWIALVSSSHLSAARVLFTAFRRGSLSCLSDPRITRLVAG